MGFLLFILFFLWNIFGGLLWFKVADRLNDKDTPSYFIKLAIFSIFCGICSFFLFIIWVGVFIYEDKHFINSLPDIIAKWISK